MGRAEPRVHAQSPARHQPSEGAEHETVSLDLLGGLFIVGLILWWIIKSDLKEMALEKSRREENEKSNTRDEAAMQQSRREEATAREQERIWRLQEQQWDREREAALLAKQREFEREKDAVTVVLFRMSTYLKGWQDQCRSFQDAEGLLPAETVGRILGWGVFRDGGSIAYSSYRWGAIINNDHFYASSEECPFPIEIRSGFFRARDVIAWLDEADREQRHRLLALPEEQRRRLLPTPEPP